MWELLTRLNQLNIYTVIKAMSEMFIWIFI